MTPTITNDDAWSCYWQHQFLESCVATGPNGNDILTKIWHDFVASLPPQSTLLDLATGNGSVLHCISRKRSDLQLTGVDYATIVPATHFLSKTFDAINFIPHTDITQLPFTNNSFDSVTSQFGFEYADTHLASDEMIRVLKTGGRFQLIIHHHQSEVLQTSKRKHKELEHLFQAPYLLACLTDFINNKISQSELESHQRQHVENYQAQVTDSVTGQIMRGIRQITLQKAKAEAEEMQKVVINFQQQITADFSRLSQLCSVALNPEEIAQLILDLKGKVAEVSYEKLVQVDVPERIFAWKICGIK